MVEDKLEVEGWGCWGGGGEVEDGDGGREGFGEVVEDVVEREGEF